MDRVRAVPGLMHVRLYCVGVQAGKFHITMDFLGDVFRATAACASPRANSISDLFHGLVGFVGPPHLCRRRCDADVVYTIAHRSD